MKFWKAHLDKPLLPTRSTVLLYLGRISDGLVPLLFVGSCFAVYFFYGQWWLYLENWRFETGQNLLLLASIAIFAVTALRETDRLQQSIFWGLALFCMNMLVREFDVRETDLEPYVSVISKYRIHYLVLAILWSAWLFRVAREMGATWRQGVQWVRSLPGAWFLTAVVLYIISDLIEKILSDSDFNLAMMLEESVELFGTLFFFYAGYVSLRRQARLTTSRQTPSPDGGQ